MTPESANRRKQLLSRVQRFEEDESLRPMEAERLVISIFEGCDLPIMAQEHLRRSGTGSIVADFDFEATIGGRQEKVAGEVKLTKEAISKEEVNRTIERVLQHNYDRFLFISRAGFSRAALKLAGDEHLGRVDLLNPQDLRRWIEKHALVDPPAEFNGELIIRECMQKYAAWLAENPEQLNTVEWRDFERIMRETFEGLGFDTVLTPSTKDGGFDLEVRTVEDGTPAVYLVEVKRWTAPSRPGNSVLKNFLLAVEEQHIRFDALRVKDAGWQTKQGVNICLLQQLATHGLSGTAFKKNIVRDNNSGPAMLLENGKDVLEEIELFVASRSPEIVPMDNQRLFLFVPGFVDDGYATLLPEWWICKDHFIFTVLRAEGILHKNRHIRIVPTDAMQQ
jgi:Restriction endonuclease